jgi:hypothetical protein
MKHLVGCGLVVVLILSACGDAGDGSTDAGTPTPSETSSPADAPTSTAPPEEVEDLGTAGKLLSLALVDEGFTRAEADCLSRAFTTSFGDTGLAEMLPVDEPVPESADAIDEYVPTCLTPDRLEEFGAADAPKAAGADIAAALSCTDPAGDIRSEFSGWTPSILWGVGDVAALEFSIADGILSVMVRTQGTSPPTGGPGPTPFITRMYLVTGDQAGPVACDIELLRLGDAEATPGTILVTTVDGTTGERLAAETYDDLMIGPGLITASIPVAAVEPVVRADFWLEVRTEWGAGSSDRVGRRPRMDDRLRLRWAALRRVDTWWRGDRRQRWRLAAEDARRARRPGGPGRAGIRAKDPQRVAGADLDEGRRLRR